VLSGSSWSEHERPCDPLSCSIDFRIYRTVTGPAQRARKVAVALGARNSVTECRRANRPFHLRRQTQTRHRRCLGNNTVEVVDTFAGRDIHSITGAAAPQGVVYVADLDKLFVANGTDGKLRIYDGDSFKLLNTVDIGEDADNVRYDPVEKKVYVAFGGDEGDGIAVIDAASGKRLEDAAKLDAHPESFQIATSKSAIYANIATKAKVVVIDRATHKVTEWPLKTGKANYPMAFDEGDHRVFVVTRKPAQLVVLDSDSGATVGSVPCVSDADDLYFDAGRKRIYVPGGEGFISVIQQIDADHYRP